MAMMKYICSAGLLLLAGCATADYRSEAQIKCSASGYAYDDVANERCVEYHAAIIPKIRSNESYPTPAQFLCEKDGIKKGAANYDSCLAEKTVAVKDAKQKAAENLAGHKIESDKEDKKAAAKQMAADVAKCRNYGFERGTNPFANCMMRLENIRHDDENKEKQRDAMAAALMGLSSQIKGTSAPVNTTPPTPCSADSDAMDCY